MQECGEERSRLRRGCRLEAGEKCGIAYGVGKHTALESARAPLRRVPCAEGSQDE